VTDNDDDDDDDYDDDEIKSFFFLNLILHVSLGCLLAHTVLT